MIDSLPEVQGVGLFTSMRCSDGAEEQVYYSDFLAATLDVRKQIRKAFFPTVSGTKSSDVGRESYGGSTAPSISKNDIK